MTHTIPKYSLLLFGLISLTTYCNAQDTITFANKKVMEFPLLGTWDFLPKSTSSGDTMKFSIANSYNFLTNNVYEHKEKGEIVERGNWKMVYDTLILTNRIWYKKSGIKPLVLEKRERLIYIDRNSFFIKTAREGKTLVILFQRGIKHNGDLKVY